MTKIKFSGYQAVVSWSKIRDVNKWIQNCQSLREFIVPNGLDKKTNRLESWSKLIYPDNRLIIQKAEKDKMKKSCVIKKDMQWRKDAALRVPWLVEIPYTKNMAYKMYLQFSGSIVFDFRQKLNLATRDSSLILKRSQFCQEYDTVSVLASVTTYGRKVWHTKHTTE